MPTASVIALSDFAETRNVSTGTVTWVDARTGRGFIAADEGGVDLFVDPSDSEAGEPLVVDARVEFERRVGRKGRLVARNVALCVPRHGNAVQAREESRWTAGL